MQKTGDIQMDFRVEGMTCGGCERAIEKALLALDGVHSPEADAQRGEVTAWVHADVPRERLKHAIEGAGFTVVVS